MAESRDNPYHTELFSRLPAEKRTGILDRATEEFSRLGYRTANINVIAEKCGVSVGALYKYFSTKENLFLAVCSDAVGRLAGSLEDVEAAGGTLLDKVERLLETVRAELAQVRQQPVTRQELDRAKRYLVGSHDIALQQRATVASGLAFNDLYGLGYAEYLRYPSAVRAVTVRDLQRVARRYLAPRREVTAVVAPPAAPAEGRE